MDAALKATNGSRLRSLLVAVAVGVALADSSVVTLALPDILRRFDLTITAVAWVLTSYNLVLALAAVPAAYLARRRPGHAFAAGTVLFAVASLLCGLAPDFAVLLAGRCLQAAGGALVVVAALDLLRESAGGGERSVRVWAVAGVVGAALGPAIGGVLTATIGWEWIFLLQAPLALLALPVARRLGEARPAGTHARPRLGANLALLLLSGGLVAALFLLVLLLVDGWRMSPALAGLVVTVMPLAAIAASRGARAAGTGLPSLVAGLVLVSGGLCALALLPHAGWGWTIAPQLLVGAGIGLTLAPLTERALAGRRAQVVEGGWTIASRHAGVVCGLLLLAPLFTSALDRNREEALRAGTAAVLDSHIPPLDKLGVAQAVLRQVEHAHRQVPEIAPAFDGRPHDSAYRSLLAALQDQLDRGVTHAFSQPFFLAAAFALAALLPLAFVRRRRAA